MSMKSYRNLRPFIYIFVAAMAVGTAAADEVCNKYFDGQRYTLVVPNKAGGGNDSYTRTLARVFSEQTGASTIVTNLPAGGGSIAVRNIANAAADDFVFGLTTTSRYIDTQQSVISPDQIQFLAGVNVEARVWSGRPDAVIEDFVGTNFVSGKPSGNGVIRVYLPAKLMGSSVTAISGYGGSVEQRAALLRGEIDLWSSGEEVSTRAQKNGDSKIVMTISEGPLSGHEDVPFLAGEGGVVDRLTKDLPADERNELMAQASLLVNLTKDIRGFFVSSNVQGEQLACLKQAVYTAISSDDYIDGMAAYGQPVRPIDPETGAQFVSAIVSARLDGAELVESVIAEFSN